MHEDLIKFRKMCLTLLDDKKLHMKDIVRESKISITSLLKYLHGTPEEMPKLRASTLGAMQDFIRNHTIDMEYSGIPKETLTGKQEWKDRQSKPSGKDIPVIDIAKMKEELNSQPLQRVKLEDIETGPVHKFWHFIGQAALCKPDNVEVVITISSKL